MMPLMITMPRLCPIKQSEGKHMMKKNQLLVVLATGLVAAPMAAQAHEEQSVYDFQQIDYPGQTQTQVFGINDSGDAVGIGADPDTLPFVYESMDGRLTDVPPADGYATTSLVGINDAGVMVGTVRSLDLSTASGFIRSKKGTYTVFSHPDAGSFTSARGVNNKGLVSGYYRDTANTAIGFIYDSKTETFADIDTGSSLFTIAHGINSKGEVVGNAWFSSANDPCGSGSPGDVQYAWLRARDGSVTFFQINGQSTSARGINDMGLIVGQTVDPFTFERKGFIAKAPESSCESVAVATSDLLQFPGLGWTIAEGITNSGVIVGIIRDALNNVHGFIATPR